MRKANSAGGTLYNFRFRLPDYNPAAEDGRLRSADSRLSRTGLARDVTIHGYLLLGATPLLQRADATGDGYQLSTLAHQPTANARPLQRQRVTNPDPARASPTAGARAPRPSYPVCFLFVRSDPDRTIWWHPIPPFEITCVSGTAVSNRIVKISFCRPPRHVGEKK